MNKQAIVKDIEAISNDVVHIFSEIEIHVQLYAERVFKCLIIVKNEVIAQQIYKITYRVISILNTSRLNINSFIHKLRNV